MTQQAAASKPQTAGIAGSDGEAEPGLPQSLRTAGAWRGTEPLALCGLQGLQRGWRPFAEITLRPVAARREPSDSVNRP